MSSAPFGTRISLPQAVDRLEGDAVATPAPPPRTPPSMPTVRHNRRAEDTGAGCRANAAADLARAGAPGGDYMRRRLEQSAAVWTERATLLERLEKSFQRRVNAA